MAGKKGKGKGNNTSGRVKQDGYKTIDGKTVRPVLYAGKSIGHGTYMAGSVDGEMVMGRDGRPIPYKRILSDEKKKVSA